MQFALFGVALMVLLGFTPLVTAAEYRDDLASPLSSSGRPRSTSTSNTLPANKTTDSPGGPSPPPGTVLSALTPDSSIASPVPPDSAPPRLKTEKLGYRYLTVAGTYFFPKVAPYLMAYETEQGDRLVGASTFVVDSTNVTLFRKPEVLNATDEQFATRYQLKEGGRTVGNMTIAYDFRYDAPPKITAELRQAEGDPHSITWVSVVTDTFALNGTTPRDFRPLDPPVRFETRTPRLTVGPDEKPYGWKRRVIFDWSDEESGEAWVGKFSRAEIVGPAVLVRFPAGMTVVDPMVAGSSSMTDATAYSMQRKTFAYANRFWAFWNDGSNIAYASYAGPPILGMTGGWSSKMTTPSGAVGPGGFDVDQRDGEVFLAIRRPSGLGVRAMIGWISGTTIVWRSPCDLPFFLPWDVPPSAVIGTDNQYWIAVVDDGTLDVHSPFPRGARVFRSANPCVDEFEQDYDLYLEYASPLDTIARLVVQPNGQLVLVIKEYDTIITVRYTAAGWSSPTLHAADVVTSFPSGDIVSAISDTDGSVVMALHRDPPSSPAGLDVGVLPPTEDVISYTRVADGETLFPTISRGGGGDMHLYWREYDPATGRFTIQYSRELPLTGNWAPPISAFGDLITEPKSLTTGPIASSHSFLIWSQGLYVMFGALPTPTDVASQTGEPWNRQGLSPFQSYFSHQSEHVSPGNGLLTVAQSDLALPGKGLGLSIARVYVTPRTFVANSPTPYLYEENPDRRIGAGWNLDLPWLSEQYVHLGGGQSYVIEWSGDRFENHNGQHFVVVREWTPSLKYLLKDKGGVIYEFDNLRRLVRIEDPVSPSNAVSFDYGGTGTRIQSIIDTLGRSVVFSYNPDNTLKSIVSGEQSVTYSYETVAGFLTLAGVTDSIGRETTFSYDNPNSPYLLTSITYPTGGRTVYTWSVPTPVTTELQSYLVTLQDVQNAVGESVKANSFSYEIGNGRVNFVTAGTFDAGAFKGKTEFLFNHLAGRQTTTVKDSAHSRVRRQVSSFGLRGEVEQVDVYSGAATTPSYSLRMGYDDWGNPIYTRDAIGHERFASYVNTRSQGGFSSPPDFLRSSSGLLFFDDFDRRDTTGWQGYFATDYFTYETLTPALSTACSPGLAVGSASHGFAAQGSNSFWLEVNLQVWDNTDDHYVRLLAGGTQRVSVGLRGNQKISYYSSGSWTDVMPYSADQWYHLAVRVRPSTNQYDLWVNGQYAAGAISMTGTGAIDAVKIEDDCGDSVYVDMVKVFKDSDVTVTGLHPFQVVEIIGTFGDTVGTGRADGLGNAYVYVPPDNFPFVTVNVYAPDGTFEFSSPTHEFWGGDAWSYTGPWSKMPLTRTVQGFKRYTNLYVDDEPPSVYLEGEEDGWNIGGYDFPVGPYNSHQSKLLTGMHHHRFRDATDIATVSSSDFLIEYVYIPEGRYPSEIMLEYQAHSDGQWNHRAFWGADLIDWSPRVSMGSLPGTLARWRMLAASASDLGLGGDWVQGISYALYGGQATWDFSAVGDSETGSLVIENLPSGWTATLKDPNDHSTLGAGNTWQTPNAIIDLYNGPRTVRSFPVEGYLVIEDQSNSPIYRSPVLAIWGGDHYRYDGTAQGTDFYANYWVDSDNHGLAVGVLEYQTGRGMSPEVVQDTYYDYDVWGRPRHVRARDDGGVFRELELGYSTYHPWWVKDPLGNLVHYEYSQAYSNAYVTQMWDGAGGPVVDFTYAYDHESGRLLSSKDPLGFRTRFAYDAAGRPVAERHYKELPYLTNYWDMEKTTEEATPRIEDLGRSSHGTIIGTRPEIGVVGESRSFDGASKIVQTDCCHANWKSLAGWFRVDQYVDYERFFSHGDFTDPDYNLILISDTANSHRVYVAGKRNGGPEGQVFTDFTPPLGEWFHLVVNLDGDNTRVYINGNDRTSSVTPGIGESDFSDRWAIGGDPDMFASLVGGADEVYSFDFPLDAYTIEALYDNTFQVVSSSFIAYDDEENVLTSYEPTTVPRLLHLDMESMLNGRLEDLGGHGLHGALSNPSPTTVQGQVGMALSFSGQDQFVSVADSTKLVLGPQFTVASWINPDTLPPTGTDATIVRKVDHAPDRGYIFDLLPNGALSSEIWKDGVQQAFTSDPAFVTPGAFTHAAFTFSSGVGQFYVNGLPVPTTSAGPPLTSPSGNAVPLFVGAADGTYEEFDGVIDEVHILNRKLDDAAIQALYGGEESGFYDKQYFDSLGRPSLSVRRDLFGALVSTESYTHDYRDQIVSYTSPRDTTTYEYDFLGRPTKVLHPGTNPVMIAYDDEAMTRSVTTGNGRQAYYVYDTAGRLLTVTEACQTQPCAVPSYGYDEVGNLVLVGNALGQITTHEYDSMNRLKKTTYADQKDESFTYDAVGNLKTRTDRSRVVTSYEYDELFLDYRLENIDYPGTTEDVSYTYDVNGNLIAAAVGPAANPSYATTYAYDALDRVETETMTVDDPVADIGFPVDYAYDDSGRVRSITYPPDFEVPSPRRVIFYDYDAVGRVQTVQSNGMSAAFSYEPDDLVKDSLMGPSMFQSYEYTPRGWPSRIVSGDEVSTYFDLSHAFDDSGNMLSRTDSVAGVTTLYDYDDLDRLETADGGFGLQEFTYDSLGNRQELREGIVLRPNGLASPSQWTRVGCSANWQCVDDEPGHDGDASYVREMENGEQDNYNMEDLPGPIAITSVTVTAVAKGVPLASCVYPDPDCVTYFYLLVNGDRSPLQAASLPYESASHTWTTNPAGGAWDWTAVQDLVAGVEHVDNPLYPHETLVTQLFVTVDSEGTTYAYNDGPTGMNQLTSTIRGGVPNSFTYDDNLNLLTKSTDSWSFTWTYENLLRDATKGIDLQAHYEYDALGRRVKENHPFHGGEKTVVYSGGSAIFERDAGGNPTAYVYANGMLVAKLEGAFGLESVSYYFGDHLGSTQQVRDGNGILVFSSEYEPFGTPYATFGSEAYKYTTEKHDDPTGLVYLRARQYDPEIGRFVSADPVLGALSAPQMQNRYTYVVNNPLKYTDPSGEVLNLVAGAFGALIGGIAGGVSCALANGLVGECWGAVAEGAVAGGLIGLCLGVCAGAVLAGAVFAAGVAGGAAGYVVQTAVTGERPTLSGLGASMLIGGATSLLGLGIAKGLSALGKALAKTGFGKWIAKGLNRLLSPFKNWLAQPYPHREAFNFANRGALYSHWLRHPGYLTPRGYLRGANAHIARAIWGEAGYVVGARGPAAAERFVFHEASGWFVRYTETGLLRSAFIPDEPMTYVANQFLGGWWQWS